MWSYFYHLLCSLFGFLQNLKDLIIFWGQIQLESLFLLNCLQVHLKSNAHACIHHILWCKFSLDKTQRRTGTVWWPNLLYSDQNAPNIYGKSLFYIFDSVFLKKQKQQQNKNTSSWVLMQIKYFKLNDTNKWTTKTKRGKRKALMEQTESDDFQSATQLPICPIMSKSVSWIWNTWTAAQRNSHMNAHSHTLACCRHRNASLWARTQTKA